MVIPLALLPSGVHHTIMIRGRLRQYFARLVAIRQQAKRGMKRLFLQPLHRHRMACFSWHLSVGG